ncbi:hypothetical protein [Cronobacter phage JC01]|uniref:Uncharacterized protein n=1 Tax=Cronobacter phage JC01 TaxID=2729575 RepID=A0A6M3YKN0_9CAUD|nr:hypothetical protein JT331_gp48 [Cronobacter phage JC01]QJI52291.1 hypothetical protein [Cronobacter phage JC01]
MSKTFDEIISEQKGKTLTFTTEQMLDFFSWAFHAGHDTSRHTPNIAGTIKHYFIHTDEFHALSSNKDRGQQLFLKLVDDAMERAEAAMQKFPQPNYVLTKFGEEAGEVTKECVHYLEGRGSWHRVESEMVDVLAMMIRLLREGDQVHGFIPPYLKGDADEQ